MKEQIIEFAKENNNIECFAVMTNQGVRINAKGNELLAMISCLANELKGRIPKKDFKKAIDIGFETEDSEIERLNKKIEKLDKLLKELRNE